MNNNENYNIRSRSTPHTIENVKMVKISDLTIPPPSNVTINNNNVIKLDIREFSNITHREYPFINYIFLFRVEDIGNRKKLTPLNDTYHFTKYLTVLQSITFQFYYQNLVLEFPRSKFTTAFNFAVNPVQITTSSAHGLVNGDEISIYEFAGSDSRFDLSINSLHSVTVLDPTTFTIPFDLTTITGNSPDIFVIKNKIEFLLDILCL